MKNLVIRPIIVMLFFASQASAALEVGTAETFSSGLSDWVRMADTEWTNSEGGYARVGKDRSVGPYLHSSITSSFDISTAGTYEIGFDYRFVGYDRGALDDTVSVAIDSIDETLAFLESRTDLSYVTTNFNNIRGNWGSISYSVDLEPGVYDLTFELTEAAGGVASTEFDVDNVYVFADPDSESVPEPASCLLLAFGVMIARCKRNGIR